MRKYVASTPQAEVIGRALLAYDDALEYESFKPILAQYDLLEIDPEKWYPQQLTLDIQKAIKGTAGGSNALISIGMKIIDTAVFPPMDSLNAAIEAFASSYPLNFRHQAPDDLIHAHQINDNLIRVINCSPHSDEMIYGYVYALVRRFAPKGKFPVVKFADLRAVDRDGDTVIEVTLG